VSVLDFANPYSAGFGFDPPRSDSSWLHWGRNVNAKHFIPPEDLLADVEVVMVPRWGVNNLPLWDLYGPFIRTNYEVVADTPGWTLHLRRQRQARQH
jgi:hypothetical protein